MKRPTHYVLDGDGEPQPCDDLLVWCQWWETADRVVKQDYAENAQTTDADKSIGAGHAVGVSTVFLGLDHQWRASGPPILWESMVFGTSLDGTQQRYSSKADALRGHEELVKRVREMT